MNVNPCETLREANPLFAHIQKRHFLFIFFYVYSMQLYIGMYIGEFRFRIWEDAFRGLQAQVGVVKQADGKCDPGNFI